MGNRVSGPGKVILSNGVVFSYDKPLTVAELMMDHPQEVVVELDGGMKKASPPLPADHILHFQKLYLMLPMGKLSSEHTRQILIKVLKPLRYFTGVVPLLVKIWPAAPEAERAIKSIKSDNFTEIVEGRPGFLSRQISGKGWKPSLDPIKERTIKCKVRHWVF